MGRAIPKKFNPTTMRVDKSDPKVIYVSTMTCGESVANPESGYILIGVKDRPSKKEIAEVIKHEKGHLERRQFPIVGIASLDHLTRARHELASYGQERKSSSARGWNKVLPTRIKQFMGYLTWVSKANQAKIKTKARKVLAPKKGGGNEMAICQARADLAQWWLAEEKIPNRCSVMAVKRPIKDIERELSSGAGVARPQPMKPGIAYASSGRLSRKPYRGWKKVRFT